MPIIHIGHSSIFTPNKILRLKNILHVPNATKNLLSVHKFTYDNNAVFEFDPDCYFIKDRATGITLLKGHCEKGLYFLSMQYIGNLRKALSRVKTSYE